MDKNSERLNNELYPSLLKKGKVIITEKDGVGQIEINGFHFGEGDMGIDALRWARDIIIENLKLNGKE